MRRENKLRDALCQSGGGTQGGRGRPPVENMKEDIYTARKVKDTLGCYPLNEKSEKTLDFFSAFPD